MVLFVENDMDGALKEECYEWKTSFQYLRYFPFIY